MELKVIDKFDRATIVESDQVATSRFDQVVVYRRMWTPAKLIYETIFAKLFRFPQISETGIYHTFLRFFGLIILEKFRMTFDWSHGNKFLWFI